MIKVKLELRNATERRRIRLIARLGCAEPFLHANEFGPHRLSCLAPSARAARAPAEETKSFALP